MAWNRIPAGDGRASDPLPRHAATNVAASVRWITRLSALGFCLLTPAFGQEIADLPIPPRHVMAFLEQKPPNPLEMHCLIFTTTDELGGWMASCRVRLYGREIWNKYLPLARPASYEEATEAVGRFREKRLPEILAAHGMAKEKTLILPLR